MALHVQDILTMQSENVLTTLNKHGYKAYWVGGCVRDELLERVVDPT